MQVDLLISAPLLPQNWYLDSIIKNQIEINEDIVEVKQQEFY